LLQTAGAWNVFSSSQLGVPAGLAFTSRLSTSVGPSPIGLTNPPAAPSGNTLTSDTGELRWNLSQAGKGLVTVNAPRTKAVIGYADQRLVNLGGITLKPGTTQMGWCTLGLTLIRGEVFTNDCAFLVIATGWWENTGQVWTGPNKTSVGNRWGRAPVLAEVVPFTLTLPVGVDYTRAWSLDERGQRKAPLPLSGNETSTVLTVNTNAGSLWYEINIDRWLASFDLWRARYFTAAEQADAHISGPAAMPDGDRVPNLWKYYLGLPGHVPAPRHRLPLAGLLSLSGQQYLALTYARDRLANDVACAAAVSPDLTTWFSGPAYSQVHSTIDLGPLVQVTERDLQPVQSAARKFMALQLQRR
jgi:hypothetical protein